MTQMRWWMLVVVAALVASADGQAATKTHKKTDEDSKASSKSALVQKSYPVGDLLSMAQGRDVDLFINFVEQAVQPKSWKETGGQGCMTYDPESKCLVVKQTAANQVHVRNLLKALDKLQAKVERDPPAPLSGALLGTVAGALCGQPVIPAGYASTAPAPCARCNAKQYGHFVMDDIKVNAMGVTTTIKKIKFMYKGDGIEADVAKCALTNGDSEHKGDMEKLLNQLSQLVDEMKGKKDEKEKSKESTECHGAEPSYPAPSCISSGMVPPAPCASTCAPKCGPSPCMPESCEKCDKDVTKCKCEEKSDKCEEKKKEKCDEMDDDPCKDR